MLSKSLPQYLPLAITVCIFSSKCEAAFAEDAPKEIVEPAKYVGNCQSFKFHRPRCPYCRVMAKNKRISFARRFMAIDGGYTPCRYCLPPTWTTTTAKIISPLPEAPVKVPAIKQESSIAPDKANSEKLPDKSGAQKEAANPSLQSGLPLGETGNDFDISSQ